jgi:transaldolase/glucose-6-phosphate isomerase
MVSTSQTPTTQQLLAQGQSVWLDYIRRDLLTSGRLKKMVDDGWVTGMTSNPTIFEKAIAGSSDYDDALKELARHPRESPYEAFTSLAVEDIRAACDILRPVYDRMNGEDGFVSLEVPPGIESDREKTSAEVQRLFKLADRRNVMIKIPGTPAGAGALEDCIAAGVNVNMTLLFALEAYEATALAYIQGLERRLDQGLPIAGIASVASFFVSRVDTAVDAQLPEGSPLRGKAAIANARAAYRRFQQIFSGPRWDRLAAAGAKVQRPLWASTGTKNAAYSDIVYVEELIAPHTVNTMPEATLKAVLDHLVVRPTVEPNLDDADRTLAALKAAGVDLDAVTAKLLVDGLAAFDHDFGKLLAKVDATLALYRVGAPPSTDTLGPLASGTDERLAELEKDAVVAGVFAGDYKLWKQDPAEISDRLGWIPVLDRMRAGADELTAFARGVASEGYTTAVLLGMGGSSLAPEVLYETFGAAAGMLDLKVLDTTVPSHIRDVENSIDLQKTLFIVASKSGGTIETLSHLAYFWDKIPDGDHFIAITDPGTSLEALANERHFRRTFANPPEIGGRYSVLSYFGLVPAALIGVDIRKLLDQATEMRAACAAETAAADNPAAWLGAVMGEAALHGRDKLTLVMPHEFATLGYWIEQLIAESTGKEGRGILPVEGEPLGPPRVYGADRLFAAIGKNASLNELADAGQPVIRLDYTDRYQLGAEFFRWELATAIAGHILRINPFDQPNVQEAKDATARILAGGAAEPQLHTLADTLASVMPGDYIAITAYLNRNAANIDAFQSIRVALRDRFHVATTVGFGPRFLHSTGQFHKGGPNSGVFIQVVDDAETDLPIPGKPYGFGALNRAQALGDLTSLQAHGRRVTRVSLAELTAAARATAEAVR